MKQGRWTVCHIGICGRLVCFLFLGLPTSICKRQTIGHFLFWCGHIKMKKSNQIQSSNLVLEVLGTVVCEKTDLVWTLTFTRELHKRIVEELLVRFPMSVN